MSLKHHFENVIINPPMIKVFPKLPSGRHVRAIGARQRTRVSATDKKRPNSNLTASDIVTQYYSAYNNKDIDQVLSLFSEDIVYEDLIYQNPFEGKASVTQYFKKIGDVVPKDIQFVVDDITEGDESKCGVMWHVEMASDNDGLVQLPFSRGCSFYHVDPKTNKITFARDLVEPTIKPGESALQGISVVAPLVKRLGSKANPSNISSPDGKNLISAATMFGFSLSYIGFVLFSDIPPGLPAYQTNIEDLETILHESLNFFYVNMAMGNFGLNIVPNIAEHPVDEGLFNFINAWSLMFLPVWVSDPKSLTMPWKTKLQLWIGSAFLTNVFMPFYMAQRLIPDIYRVDGENSSETPTSLGQGTFGARAIGIVSLVVGLISIGWMIIGRSPEYSTADRIEFFVEKFTTNRVFWAFCLDAVLYYVWQYWILSDLKAPSWQKFTPFFGMVGFLLKK
jgi:ketosteroid isomerase-like protein